MKRKLDVSVKEINYVRQELGFDTYEIVQEQPSSLVDEAKEKLTFKEKCNNFLKSTKAFLKKFYNEVFRFPSYIMSHPVQGWQEFKQEKRGKMSVAITIILL